MKLYPNITYIFVIWVAAVLATAYIGFSTLPRAEKVNSNFWESLGHCDGGHYRGIAQVGYSEKFQYAFFPLYPLAIKLFNQITQNYLMAAVLVSILATFLGLQLLYGLVAADFGKKIAEKTILAFLFFPTAFYLITAYSEGLFFFLTILTFYLLRKNKLFWATLTAALVSATRVVGLAIVVGLIIEIWLKQGFNRKNWFVFFAPLGFVIYSMFLFRQTGDPLYFITAENHWQRVLAVPGVGFWETLKNISGGGFITSNFNIFLDLIFAIFGVGFAIRSFRFLSPSFAVYSLLSISIPLFTPSLSSIPRFLLVIFPLFILVALIKNQYILYSFQIFSLMLLAIFTVLFFNGYWVS